MPRNARAVAMYALDSPAGAFDACFCHSVLEALDRPVDALRELRRVLRPGGVIAVASVNTVVWSCPGRADNLIRRFYDIRQQLWLLTSSADPFLGRRLRGFVA